jgi:ABC-type uncharacterized transport system involved in gliding motility auxiliary subunit
MNKKKIFSYLSGINVIIAVVLINVVLSFYPFLKLDLSQNKVHSLSPTSKDIVKKLDDIITIKVFASQDLPTNIKPIAGNLKTILEEFSRLNRGKFRVQYLDPSKDQAASEEAVKLGIQQLQFSSMKSDKFEVSTGYLGLAIIYGDKRVVLPVAGDVGNLEYFIDSGIKQALRKTVPSVAIAEPGAISNTGIQYFRKYLEQNYKIESVSLNGDSKIPTDADSLVIVGNPGKIDDKGVAKIKEWVDSNKGLIAFIDGVTVTPNLQGETNPDTGLEPLLKDKGIDLQKDLILDANSAYANFNTKNGAFLVQYPYWIKIRPENVNNSIPAVSGINSVMIPWSSSLKLSGEAKSLLSSSDKSIVTSDFSSLTPSNSDFIGQVENSKQIIGAINTSNNNKIAVIGNSNFIKDQFLGESQQNLYLALNMVDYFSQDQSLLTIRSKELVTNPIMSVNDNLKQIIRWTNVVLPIAVLAGFALGVNFVRKKKNNTWK